MSEIIAPLHVLTECDVTSNVFGVGRRTVWKQVQESTENQIQIVIKSVMSRQGNFFRKQPYRDVLKKRCSENMQQTYRTPMPKCDFNKVAKQLSQTRTLSRVFFCEFCEVLQKVLFQNIFGLLNLTIPSWHLPVQS